MKNKIFFLITVILIISIFSIGLLYSADSGSGSTTTSTSTSGTGGTATTSTSTDQTGVDSGKRDLTQYLNPEGAKPENYGQRIVGIGQVGAERGKDGTSTLTIGKGGKVEFYNVDKDGKASVKTSSFEGFEGKIKFVNGKVSGIDIKNTASDKNTLSLPIGKNNDVYNIQVPKGDSRILYQPTTGKQNPIEVLIDSKNLPVKIEQSPSIERKGTSPDPNSPSGISYKGNGPIEFPIGNNQNLISQPIKGDSRIGYEFQADGKSLAYSQQSGGEFTRSSSPDSKGVSIKGNEQRTYFTSSDSFPKGAKPGNYLNINSNSIEVFNTNTKSGSSPVYSFLGGEKGNSFIDGMKTSDGKTPYVGLSAGPESGFKLNPSGGLEQISFTGKMLGQAEIDGRVIDSKMVSSVFLNGQSESKREVFETIGENYAPKGSSAPKVEINLGDKSIKMETDDGKIIDTNGKIVAVQDGDKVRMAVVASGEDSNKKIAQLLNHEITSGEIMDDKNRVVVNPPNPPQDVKPIVEQPIQPPENPVQPTIHTEPVTPPEPQVPKWFNKANPAAVLASQQGFNPANPNPPQLIAYHFRADWCGPCRALESSGAYDRIKAENPNVHFVEVDLTAKNPKSIQGQLSAQHQVSGIPAISFVNPQTGSPVLWNGPAGGAVSSTTISSGSLSNVLRQALNYKFK